MSEHTYKVIELVGSSKNSIEEAVKNALSKAFESLRNSRWFEVTQIRGEIENDKVAYWQVGLKLGFTVENGQKEKVSGEPGKRAKGSKETGPLNGRGKYRCKVCGYIYDPEKGDPDNGINPGTPFRDLPEDWVCPECGVNKDQFEEMGE